MKAKWMIAAVGAVFMNASARAGGTEGHGGFAYKRAYAYLKQASDQLSSEVSALSPASLTMIGGQRDRLATIVRHDRLLQLPSEFRSRGDQPLELDYDAAADSLVVLAPFYIVYSSQVGAQVQPILRDIKSKLLHEAGHLFGLSEEDAARFAEITMKLVDPMKYFATISFQGPKPGYISGLWAKVDGRVKTPAAGFPLVNGMVQRFELGWLERDVPVQLEWFVSFEGSPCNPDWRTDRPLLNVVIELRTDPTSPVVAKRLDVYPGAWCRPDKPWYFGRTGVQLTP